MPLLRVIDPRCPDCSGTDMFGVELQYSEEQFAAPHWPPDVAEAAIVTRIVAYQCTDCGAGFSAADVPEPRPSA